MAKLISGKGVFNEYEYLTEAEFEGVIKAHSSEIFGNKSIYIDIKKRIGIDNILSIPDGYLLDFTFENDPRLYIVEVELAVHDPYKHIGQQLLKFAISYKASGREIKNYLLEHIYANKLMSEVIEKCTKKAGNRNVGELLDNLIFEKELGVIVIIDEISEDLSNVLGQLTIDSDIVEFKTYDLDGKKIHEFTPFQAELQEARLSKINIEDIDTIVVPANEEGFRGVFLGENCWYSIRISSSMIERIRYIAGYQTAPISAITYVAEVKNIEKYKRTDKYIVYFKGKAKRIGPIKLGERKKGAAPQNPRYTNLKKLYKAKTLKDIWPV